MDYDPSRDLTGRYTLDLNFDKQKNLQEAISDRLWSSSITEVQCTSCDDKFQNADLFYKFAFRKSSQFGSIDSSSFFFYVTPYFPGA